MYKRQVPGQVHPAGKFAARSAVAGQHGGSFFKLRLPTGHIVCGRKGDALDRSNFNISYSSCEKMRSYKTCLLYTSCGRPGPPSVPASTPVGRSLGPGTEHGPGIRQTVPSASCDLLLFFQPGPAKAADPSAAPLPDSVPMVLLPAAQSAQAACPLLLAVLQRGTQPPVWGICRGPLLLCLLYTSRCV